MAPPGDDNGKAVEKEIIASDKAPKAIGPYSQAVRVGNTIYLSGQIAIDPATGKMVPGGIEAQTHQVLQNIQAVLEEAGFSLQDVVQSKVFLADLEHYRAMNEVYGTYFTTAPPARAAVQVARLPLDALVEIMVTAVSTE
ncbi:MAG: RidA family protein [bacterium]